MALQRSHGAVGLANEDDGGYNWTRLRFARAVPDVPPVLEIAGRNTAENASRSLPLILAVGGIRHVVVVTSVWHLRAPLFAKNGARTLALR